MSQVNEAVEDQVTEQESKTQTSEPQQEPITPIFEEVENLEPGAAVNILIQAAQYAQAAGALTVRDSVMVAAAISVLRPGTI